MCCASFGPAQNHFCSLRLPFPTRDADSTLEKCKHTSSRARPHLHGHLETDYRRSVQLLKQGTVGNDTLQAFGFLSVQVIFYECFATGFLRLQSQPLHPASFLILVGHKQRSGYGRIRKRVHKCCRRASTCSLPPGWMRGGRFYAAAALSLRREKHNTLKNEKQQRHDE